MICMKSHPLHRPTTHHDDGGEEGGAGRHGEEAVHEPGAPDDPVGDAGGLEGLLEAELLLQHDALHRHGDGVDPGQHHGHREASAQRQHEASPGGGTGMSQDHRNTLSL